MNLQFQSGRDQARISKFRTFIVATAIAVMVTSCGSTKVMTADKTVVYRDTIYNVSNVAVFKRKVEAETSGGEKIDLGGVEKSGFNALVDANGEMMVRQSFMLDDQELLYQARRIDSWSDYNRMSKQFDNAGKDIQNFLAHKKKTQLKLK